MASTCVQLVHQLPGRWRYRLCSAAALNFDLLEKQLQAELSDKQWEWRLNRRSCSLVLSQRPTSRRSSSEAQRLGWQLVVAAMVHSGATAPAPDLVRVNVRVVRDRPRLSPDWLRVPLNLTSFLLALGLLLLAALLLLLGLLGLLLPLAPGVPIMVLAFLLVESAFRLRSPFVTTAVG
jgi:hypothetical protein